MSNDDYNPQSDDQDGGGGRGGGGGGQYGGDSGSQTPSNPVAQSIDQAQAAAQEQAFEKEEKKEELHEKISALISLGIQCLQVLMACLLVVFVPQSCPAPPPPKDCVVCPNPCTVAEIFSDLNSVQIGAIIVNFVTLITTLVYQYCVWKRERWMIMHFHLDDDKYSEDNLKKTLEIYEVLNYNFSRHNYQTLILACVCLVLHIINIIISAFVVFTDRYGGGHTLTTYLTYVALVAGIFKGAIYNAWQGLRGRGLSNFTLTPYEWNMIRPEHAPKGQAEDNKKSD